MYRFFNLLFFLREFKPMKSVVVALMFSSVAFVSCSKDEGGAGSGPTLPQMTLIDGDFKNTAKSGTEVSTKLKQVATSAERTRMSDSVRRGTETPRIPRSQILSSARVTSFLTQPSDAPKVTIKDGENCASQLDALNDVYSQGAQALRSAADTLSSLDTADLPDGVTRQGPDAQFAVSYLFDLTKLDAQNTERQPEDRRVTGLAKLGAGANSDSAILALAMNVSTQGKQGSGTINAASALAAYHATETLKLSSNGSASGTVVDDNGKGSPVTLSYDGLLAVQAGAKPSLAIEASAKGTGHVNAEGSIETSTETHDIAAKVKIEKVSSTDVAVTYNVMADGKTEAGQLTMTTDASGQCVVRETPAIAAQ